MKRLEDLREDIRKVSREIIRLVAKRQSLSREIGQIKRERRMRIRDPETEAALRRTISEDADRLGLERDVAMRILNLLFESSVAVQGGYGTGELGEHERIFTEAKKLEESGRKVIHLEVGEPDFPPPRRVVEKMFEAVNQGLCRYTQTAGLPELRRAIADHHRERYGLDIGEQNVMITPGGRYALHLALWAISKPGCGVGIIEPAWSAYEECSRLIGLVPRIIRTRLEEGWSVRQEMLEEVMDEGTGILCLNSPSNPTGRILSSPEMKMIAEVARDHGITIISDEAYSDYSYKPFESVLKHADSNYILISSFSKSYAMTGFRMGYAISDRETIRKMVEIQATALSSIPEFIQVAGLEALESGEDIQRNVEIMKSRVDSIHRALGKLPVSFHPVEGGMYVFPRIEKETLRGREFAYGLLEKGIAVAPGTSFGSYPRFFRIALTQNEETMAYCLEKIGEALS